jgi:hypothetical protein
MYILLVTILHATNPSIELTPFPSEANLLFILILDPSKFLASKKGLVIDRCVGHLASVSLKRKRIR